MKVYTCSNCKNSLYFENSVCLKCSHSVGFDPITMNMVTLEPGQGGVFANMAKTKESFNYCNNSQYGVCNWLVPAAAGPGFCVACALNRVIPDLSLDQNRFRWKSLEAAKHRLVYSLLRLKLPFEVERDGKKEAVVFDFMADSPTGEKVMTGHDDGLITINISEADEVERVRHKHDLGERYRTLLGHFRHEVGHYYWDGLVAERPLLGRYRELFGDETADYSEALKTYYANGAPADWNLHFVSPYATSHPWEDWAETWAHYLHMMDTLETAGAFGIHIDASAPGTGKRGADMGDPYQEKKFENIIGNWLPLCYASNSLNRSMGHADFYPFVLSEPVIEKLKFIHGVCHGGVAV
jgi:hypothetical protein